MPIEVRNDVGQVEIQANYVAGQSATRTQFLQKQLLDEQRRREQKSEYDYSQQAADMAQWRHSEDADDDQARRRDDLVWGYNERQRQEYARISDAIAWVDSPEGLKVGTAEQRARTKQELEVQRAGAMTPTSRLGREPETFNGRSEGTIFKDSGQTFVVGRGKDGKLENKRSGTDPTQITHQDRIAGTKVANEYASEEVLDSKGVGTGKFIINREKHAEMMAILFPPTSSAPAAPGAPPAAPAAPGAPAAAPAEATRPDGLHPFMGQIRDRMDELASKATMAVPLDPRAPAAPVSLTPVAPAPQAAPAAAQVAPAAKRAPVSLAPGANNAPISVNPSLNAGIQPDRSPKAKNTLVESIDAAIPEKFRSTMGSVKKEKGITRWEYTPSDKPLSYTDERKEARIKYSMRELWNIIHAPQAEHRTSVLIGNPHNYSATDLLEDKVNAWWRRSKTNFSSADRAKMHSVLVEMGALKPGAHK